MNVQFISSIAIICITFISLFGYTYCVYLFGITIIERDNNDYNNYC